MTAPLKTIGGEVYSGCCTLPLEVTRVVHDVVKYDPTEVDEAGQLIVRLGRLGESLDSDDFEVACSGCHQSIQVEVEER